MTSDVINVDIRIVDEMISAENLKGCKIHLHDVVRNHKIW